jgi:hypothetical protein
MLRQGVKSARVKERVWERLKFTLDSWERRDVVAAVSAGIMKL